MNNGIDYVHLHISQIHPPLIITIARGVQVESQELQVMTVVYIRILVQYNVKRHYDV